MDATEAMTLFLTEKLLAISMGYQALEYIQLQKKLRVLLSWPKWYFLIPIVLFFSSVLQLFVSDFALLLVSAACFLFLIYKFRGPFAGGSDYMTALVLIILILAQLFSDNLLVVQGCLFYLSIQAVLSYLIAGLVKFKNSNWRSGQALSRLLASDYYTVHSYLKNLSGQPKLMLLASWSIIVFELLFPIAIFSPLLCFAFLQLGILFHIANAYGLGLNRFFWSWMASYPALFYLSIAVSGVFA